MNLSYRIRYFSMPIINEVHAYVDGAARGNPGASAIGICMFDENGTMICEHKQCIGEGTNQQAEYTAVLRALEIAAAHTRRKVFIYSDSELVMKHMTGFYRLKAEHLRERFYVAKDREKAFDKVIYTHKPREHPKIKRADELANQALDMNGFNK